MTRLDVHCIVSTRADDHWKELTERRISRADKLTLSWRDGEMPHCRPNLPYLTHLLLPISDAERVVRLAVRVPAAALSQESDCGEAVHRRVPPAVQGPAREHRVGAIRTHIQVRANPTLPCPADLTIAHYTLPHLLGTQRSSRSCCRSSRRTTTSTSTTPPIWRGASRGSRPTSTERYGPL